MRRESWTTSVAMAIAAAILLIPVFYNGYPILFYDTRAYLHAGFQGWGSPSRPWFYGLFLAVASLWSSLWWVVALQSLATVHLLWLVLRTAVDRPHPFVFLLFILLITIGTSAGWTVGFVVPDISTPLVILVLFLLGRTEQLSRAEAIWVALLGWGCAVSHLSNLPMIWAAAILLFLLAWVEMKRRPWALRTAVLAGSASLTIFVHNWVAYGRDYTRGFGSVFLFARLYQDGPAHEVLEEQCKRTALKLCPILDRTYKSSDQLLWLPQGLPSLGDWPTLEPEAALIVRETLRTRAGPTLKTALSNGIREVAAVKTGVSQMVLGTEQVEQRERMVTSVIESLPGDQEGLQTSRLYQRQLDIPALTAFHVPLVWMSILGCTLLGWHLRRRPGAESLRDLVVLILIALLLNAFITGGASLVHARYQSRVVWLAAWGLLAGLFWLVRTRFEVVRPTEAVESVQLTQ